MKRLASLFLTAFTLVATFSVSFSAEEPRAEVVDSASQDGVSFGVPELASNNPSSVYFGVSSASFLEDSGTTDVPEYFTTGSHKKKSKGEEESDGHSSEGSGGGGGHGHGRFQVATVDFPHVSGPFIISLWIIIAGLAKIGFHVTPRLPHLCPESCVLLLVGVLIGLLLFFTGLTSVGPLTPDVFFLFMLPPIVLDAGYFMPNRLFFDNLASILMHAVIGTVWNALAIGFSLWGIGLTGLYGFEIPLLHTLLFSSIISAVDPVAVLAVFEEIHVNDILYIIVFGESLLNDAVTVVLYHMFEGYASMGEKNMIPVDYVAGVASFFVVALGGTLVGIVWGILAAFVSRFTHHVRIIEPLFIFVMAYLSYLSAELFHLSGILALTFCGMTMKNYVEENISHKSHVTVKYGMKMLANSSETIIFVLLGVSTVNDRHEWNTAFILLTILFCSVYRALGVLMLSGLANQFRLHKFDMVEQFIMSYGGLRGAVAFALVLVISEDVIPKKNMMVTTVICVVYFTVFFQGMTIGFFVNILNVPKSSKSKQTMNQRLHLTVMGHVMAGMEGISDHLMGNFKLRDKFKYYNNRFIRPLLTRDHKIREPKIFQTYSKLNLADAMNLVKQNSCIIPTITAENGTSLSTIFRSYTQANLSNLSVDKEKSPVPHNDSNYLNVDMGELEYNPSYKDLADAEIHHILEDAMFKPQKKQRRYSRSEVFETDSHPPFHHHMRMQIRRVLNEDKKPRHTKSASTRSAAHSTGRNGHVSSGQGYHLHPDYQYNITEDENNSYSLPGQVKIQKLEDSMEDEGITFVAQRRHSSISSPPHHPSSIHESDIDDPLSSPQTVTESTLPWKRDDDSSDSKSVRLQKEFPAWVENKDYFMGYLSPTNTFLDSLTKSPRKTPSVYEVFSRIEAIAENDETNEADSNGETANHNKISNKNKPPLVDKKDLKPGSPTSSGSRYREDPDSGIRLRPRDLENKEQINFGYSSSPELPRSNAVIDSSREPRSPHNRLHQQVAIDVGESEKDVITKL